jgi:hypothetical protein
MIVKHINAFTVPDKEQLKNALTYLKFTASRFFIVCCCFFIYFLFIYFFGGEFCFLYTDLKQHHISAVDASFLLFKIDNQSLPTFQPVLK